MGTLTFTGSSLGILSINLNEDQYLFFKEGLYADMTSSMDQFKDFLDSCKSSYEAEYGISRMRRLIYEFDIMRMVSMSIELNRKTLTLEDDGYCNVWIAELDDNQYKFLKTEFFDNRKIAISKFNKFIDSFDESKCGIVGISEVIKQFKKISSIGFTEAKLSCN